MKQLLAQLAIGGLSLTLATSCGTPAADCTTSGNACDWAGHNQPPSFNGDGKALRDSGLYYPIDLTFSPDNTPYVLDWNNHRVRTVVNGRFKTVIGNFVGDGDADNADLTAAGAPGTSCGLNHPTDIKFKPDGTMILNAWHNHKIRLWDPKSGIETVMVGRGYGFEGDGKAIDSKTLMNQQKALALAPDGTIYILDQRNQRIRKIDPAGIITTVAGTGKAGSSGDGGDPLLAQFNFETGDAPNPSGALVLDTQGRLYVSDGLNNRIRRIDFAAHTIEAFAGTGAATFSGDGGPALMAGINNARDLEFGPDGRLYVADTENHCIRAIDMTTNVITTVAGVGGKSGLGAEGQPATKMELNRPFGIAFDQQKALYIADSYNNRIVRVTP